MKPILGIILTLAFPIAANAELVYAQNTSVAKLIQDGFSVVAGQTVDYGYGSGTNVFVLLKKDDDLYACWEGINDGKSGCKRFE